MAHADLAVLGGVGMLALACLVVCGLYLYWSSEGYRGRKREAFKQTRRKEVIGKQKCGVSHTAGKNNEVLSGVHATMGTQLSHRCKTSLYRAMFSSAHSESIVFLIADSRDNAR